MKIHTLSKNYSAGKLKILLLTAFTMLAVGCGEKNDLSELGWSNSKYGIGLDPPEGWTVNESGQLGMLVQFTKTLDNGRAISINLMQPAKLGDLSLMETAKQSIQMSKSILQSYELISEGSITINSMDAWEVISTMTVGETLIKTRSVMVENKGGMYAFAYGAETSNYDEYAPHFDDCLNSLKVTLSP
ncbi:hypothetical protein N8567_01245 [Akkermansiaceae bacterium]|jgi:hypothetical protein|nr:hypothetical protein [Verrucomicrobiota bacterium]MDA7616251.1 hypothetical protein [Akkermansiaceae bacterium]MDA7654914.1 hypothetical protein [Akkermansiaceae bacterium]MDB4622514.1 hypothetical protein [Akkermansiaceae bacterium]